jgi:hypothetical protein
MNRASNLLGRLYQVARKDPSVTSAQSAVVPTFRHNLALISVLYSGERPDITPHDEESKKAKNRKKLEKRKKQYL